MFDQIIMKPVQRLPWTHLIFWFWWLPLLAQSGRLVAQKWANQVEPEWNGQMVTGHARMLAEMSVHKLESYQNHLKKILGYLPRYQKKIKKMKEKHRRNKKVVKGGLKKFLHSYRKYVNHVKKRAKLNMEKRKYQKRTSRKKRRRSQKSESEESPSEESSFEVNVENSGSKSENSLDQKLKNILNEDKRNTKNEDKEESETEEEKEEDEDEETGEEEEENDNNEETEEDGKEEEKERKEDRDEDEDVNKENGGEDEREIDEEDDEDEDDNTEDFDQFLNNLQKKTKISESKNQENTSTVSELENKLENMLQNSSKNPKSDKTSSKTNDSSSQTSSRKQNSRFNFSLETDSESKSVSFKLTSFVPEESLRSTGESSSSISIKLKPSQPTPKITKNENCLQKVLLAKITKLEHQIANIQTHLRMFYVYGNEPLFKSFGDRSLDQLSMSSGSVTRPVLLYFAPKEDLLHFGRPAFDYIYQTVDKFHRPHYASFRIGYDEKKFEENRNLFPTKNYFGQSFYSALENLEQMQNGDFMIKNRKIRPPSRKEKKKKKRRKRKHKKKRKKCNQNYFFNSRESGIFKMIGRQIH